MLFTKVAKGGVVGGALLSMSFPKVEAKEMIACHDCRMKRLPKANELPLYGKEEEFVSEYNENSTLPLVSEISTVRKKLFEYGSYINIVQDKAVHIYDTGVSHSKSTFDYLKDEENKVQRISVIACGSLVGLLLARNRGIFKKVLYTSLGTGAVFSAFYPSLSKEYAQTGWKASVEQIDMVLTKYGGYNTDKFAKEVDEKLEKAKSIMKFDSVMNVLNRHFYKDKASKEESKSQEETTNQDMYTTRSAP